MTDKNTLNVRYEIISARLDAIEQHPAIRVALVARNLEERQIAILQRIDKLVKALGLDVSAAVVRCYREAWGTVTLHPTATHPNTLPICCIPITNFQG